MSQEERTRVNALLEQCCECKHFRMFNPECEWCTSKKERVNPFGHCKDFVLRGSMHGVSTVLNLEWIRKEGEDYARNVKDSGVLYHE